MTLDSAPTINNILEQTSLRWIFVGGKGGVGKTTCSCCLAIKLAAVRDRVLIISTDPAHNLSDAFDQKFSSVPTQVKGFGNLFAMEIDPERSLLEFEEGLVGLEEANFSADIRRGLTQLMASLPGIDEYFSYIEVLRLVRGLDYSVVVFDTAPTGHTLRLLSLPKSFEDGLSKAIAMKNQVGPLMTQVMSFMGMNSGDTVDFTAGLESRIPVVQEITQQFQDASKTTFVCVCIPEFLSMYETERLVQELNAKEIDVHNVIVNQLLFPNLLTSTEESLGSSEKSSTASCCANRKEPNTSCRMCAARHRIQSKYLEQILDLYDDMHVIQLPQLEDEVRGQDSLLAFSKYLIEPYTR